MSEVISAFLRTEFGGEGTDPARETRNGSLGCFSQMRFEFAERHLDRIEVRRIFGEVTQFRTGRFNHLAHTGNLVHREAVHHHDVAALEGGNETMFKIGHEGYCIYWSIQHEGCDHRTTAQAGDEGDRLPMPVRYMVGQPKATRAAAAKPHHGGVG